MTINSTMLRYAVSGLYMYVGLSFHGVHYSFFFGTVQSLHKACSYPEAMKVSCQIENQAYQARVCVHLDCVYIHSNYIIL